MENNLGSGNPPQKHFGEMNKNLTKVVKRMNTTNDLLHTMSENIIEIKSTLSVVYDTTENIYTILGKINKHVKSIDSKIEEPVPV